MEEDHPERKAAQARRFGASPRLFREHWLLTQVETQDARVEREPAPRRGCPAPGGTFCQDKTVCECWRQDTGQRYSLHAMCSHRVLNEQIKGM